MGLRQAIAKSEICIVHILALPDYPNSPKNNNNDKNNLTYKTIEVGNV
jgi:hypothetical protein